MSYMLSLQVSNIDYCLNKMNGIYKMTQNMYYSNEFFFMSFVMHVNVLVVSILQHYILLSIHFLRQRLNHQWPGLLHWIAEVFKKELTIYATFGIKV